MDHLAENVSGEDTCRRYAAKSCKKQEDTVHHLAENVSGEDTYSRYALLSVEINTVA